MSTLGQSKTYTFQEGSPHGDLISIPIEIRDDSKDEFSETIGLKMRTIGCGTVHSKNEYTIIINDDDGPTNETRPNAKPDSVFVSSANTLSGNVLADNGSGADTDPNSQLLMVARVNGLDANVGQLVMLPSNGMVTVFNDGDFDYDPNGAFDSLLEGETAIDDFSYTISNGTGDTDSSFVNVEISGTLALDPSLVAYYRLDGNALDVSGNGNDGVLAGGPTLISGKVGQGYDFDGLNDSIVVANDPSLQMTDAFTVSAWVKWIGNGIVVNKENEYEIAIGWDGKISYAVRNSVPGWAWVNTGFALPANQWTHIAWSYDRNAATSQLKVYANGNLVHSRSGSGVVQKQTSSTNEFRIGARQWGNPGPSSFFEGGIDEVRIHDRALTPTEIEDLVGGGVEFVQSDIGNPSPAGSLSSPSEGAFSIAAGGSDIWGASDQFTYAHQTLNGDGEIIAQIKSITGGHSSWAKAGVMIRESLAANSKHAMTVDTSGNGISFQRRTSTGGTSGHTTPGEFTADWVKISRTGNLFTGSYSLDGMSWTEIGSVSIVMADPIYIGLAVTSHQNGTAATAEFENVSIEEGTTVTGENLVQNPSFETPNISIENASINTSSLPGWDVSWTTQGDLAPPNTAILCTSTSDSPFVHVKYYTNPPLAAVHEEQAVNINGSWCDGQFKA